MEKSYRIFTGAPSVNVRGDVKECVWQTLTTHDSFVLPPATLVEAESRLSLVYRNVIFQEDSEESEEVEDYLGHDLDNSLSAGTPSFKMISDERRGESQGDSFETEFSGEGSTFLSEGSSIRKFPTFTFTLNSIISLSMLKPRAQGAYGMEKVSLLLGILEVDGLCYVKSKATPRTEMALLKIVAGSDDGGLCKIVVWKETAELWAGEGENVSALKRGDVVFFENLTVLANTRKHSDSGTAHADTGIQLTASPSQQSRAQICYRTLPTTREDYRLRPDLRLAYSVPSVRKVSETVEWIERVAGISCRA